MRTKILYEDADLLVCHKPPGLAVESAKISQPDMVSELRKYLRSSYLGVVHRLDQPVEGLLVFAKNQSAAAGLSKQLQEQILSKEYYALVCGQPPLEEARLVDYMVKNASQHRAEIVSKGTADAKEARLSYKLLKKTESVALLSVTIETGRFHQIRAQLSHMGCPILGDRKYGTTKSLAISAERGIKNVALCARTLEFMHPTTGQRLFYEIKLDDFYTSIF